MHDIQMNERGQITIPKELREQADVKPLDTLKIEWNDKGQLILYKKDFFDDLEDLIKKDLLREGVSEEAIPYKISERKKQLGKALEKMENESQEEIEKGNASNLQDLKKECNDEGLQ